MKKLLLAAVAVIAGLQVAAGVVASGNATEKFASHMTTRYAAIDGVGE